MLLSEFYDILFVLLYLQCVAHLFRTVDLLQGCHVDQLYVGGVDVEASFEGDLLYS